MNRHLLPNEIDLLLDGEVGFGTAPLKMHARRCASCRAELESARALVRELEHLPRFAPSMQFQDHVMSRVQVFVPWHAALLHTARRWIPRSRPARALAGAGSLVTAVALTLVSLWLVARLDTVILAAGLLLDRTQNAILAVLSSAVAGSLGEPMLQALRSSGALGLTLAVAVLLAAAAIAARALRSLAAPPHDR